VPDIVANGGTGPAALTAAYHRSRRLRAWLIILAALAVVLAAGSFTYSLRTNWEATHTATVAAQAAQHKAEAADDRAEAAAAQADAAHHAADQALAQIVAQRAALCLFLAGAESHAPDTPAGQARTLARAFGCRGLRKHAGPPAGR
jgi:uncharacterized membrane protein YeiB